MNENLEKKTYIPIISNIFFSLLLFSLMFVKKSDFSYLKEFSLYMPSSLSINMIGVMIIFKIVTLSIILCFSIIELFIYRVYILKPLNITNLVLISFYMLLEIIQVSLQANKTVSYNSLNDYKIFDSLNYILFAFSILYCLLSYLFYFFFINKKVKELDSILKRSKEKENEEISKENKEKSKERELFDKVKKLHEEGRISDEEYRSLLDEMIDKNS